MEIFTLKRLQNAFDKVFANKQELLNSGKIENHVNKDDAELLKKFANGDENTVQQFTQLNNDDICVMKALRLK